MLKKNGKSENELVSIIIPCYNYGEYVKKSIDSALGQTYDNIEVVIIDNGSTDNSYSVIKEFSSDRRVKIFKFDKNIPPGNKDYVVGYAILKSKGKYISLLMADDWYFPDKIKKQVELFNKSPNSVGVVYCHGYHFFDESKQFKKWKMQSVSGYVFKEYLSKGDLVIPISPLVKRFCYDIIGLENDWIGSEYDFFMMSQYVDFDYVDEHLVVMRVHQKNDRFNFLSVYERVKRYHNVALTTEATINRGGEYLIRKRMANNYLSFSYDFIKIKHDMVHGSMAIIDAVKLFPLYFFKPKVIIALLLTIMPSMIYKHIFSVYRKIKL